MVSDFSARRPFVSVFFAILLVWVGSAPAVAVSGDSLTGIYRPLVADDFSGRRADVTANVVDDRGRVVRVYFSTLCGRPLQAGERIRVTGLRRDASTFVAASDRPGDVARLSAVGADSVGACRENAAPVELPPATTIASPFRASVIGGEPIPPLASLPSARATLYLDFEGSDAMNWGGISVPAQPPLDLDGDPSGFSAFEIASIRAIWARVAEKYAPFDINVTTIRPATISPGSVLRVMVSGNGRWSGGIYGGIGYVGGFMAGGSNMNTVWVFPENLASSEKYIAEACSHEAGHALGLNHQSVYDASGNRVAEYASGDLRRAPVMGVSYNADRGLWWRGTSVSPSTIQDDVDVIAGGLNGFGYRPDVGDATQSLPLADQTADATGVLERINDVRRYTISLDSPTALSLRLDPAAQGPMLDAALRLTDAQGGQISASDTASLGESIAVPAAAGTYVVEVRSHGDTGDIGGFRLRVSTGDATGVPTVAVTAPFEGWVGSGLAPVTLSADAESTQGPVTGVSFWVDGVQIGESASPPYAISAILGGGEHHVSARAVDDAGRAARSAPLDFFLTGAQNQPPSVNAGPDRSAAVGASIVLAGVVTDDGLPLGKSLTLFWEQVSGPDRADLRDADHAQSVVSCPSPGTYRFRLTADDGAARATDDMLCVVGGSSPMADRQPFRTVINFATGETSVAGAPVGCFDLRVTDTRGRTVAERPANSSLAWDGRAEGGEAAAGIYIVNWKDCGDGEAGRYKMAVIK